MVRARYHGGIATVATLNPKGSCLEGETDLGLWFLVLLCKLMAWIAHVWELREHHGEPADEAIELSHSVG